MIAVRLIDPDGTVVAASTEPDYLRPADSDLLTSLEGWAGGVGVRGERADRLRHGEFPAQTYRTGRVITLAVQTRQASREATTAWERRMSGLFSDGGTATLEVTTEGVRQTCRVQLDGEVKTDANRDHWWATAEIPLHAPDPWIYGEERRVYLQPQGMAALEYPILTGGRVSFGTQVTATESITNGGNADAYPTVVVTADAPSGVRVSMGGRTVAWGGPCFPQAPVTIDMAGSVTVRGVDQSHLLVERGWYALPAGKTATPALSFIQSGTGFAYAAVRDTYL